MHLLCLHLWDFGVKHSCLWVSDGSYLLEETERRGLAGQISSSGAPSQTGFPKRRVSSNRFQSPAKNGDDWTKLLSCSVVFKRDRKWWGAAVPGYTHLSTYTNLSSAHEHTLNIHMEKEIQLFWVFFFMSVGLFSGIFDVLSESKSEKS